MEAIFQSSRNRVIADGGVDTDDRLELRKSLAVDGAVGKELLENLQALRIGVVDVIHEKHLSVQRRVEDEVGGPVLGETVVSHRDIELTETSLKSVDLTVTGSTVDEDVLLGVDNGGQFILGDGKHDGFLFVVSEPYEFTIHLKD